MTGYGEYFPHSRKVYVTGSRSDLRVPQREIELAHTVNSDGAENFNAPVRVYDTSGPAADGSLPELRAPWIAERKHGIKAAEGEAVRQRGLDPCLARDVGHHV